MMNHSFDIWKMLAGVAFFLLAMNIMENTLRQLAGRKFKLFLKKQTNSKIKAIGGAAAVTGVLQSSSIVNLLVLSMVGAHILQMENALALTLGANVGTTLTGWLFATVGFNFNIELFVLPVVGITGIFMAFINRESKWFLWLKFVFSLAFLFVALGFIKNGMDAFVKETDLSFFNQYPVIVFLIAGFLITTIIQSSSATVAIALSALYTSAISLYAATAIVLGSEIGTTIKLFLASADGMAAKKRVALGNFIFNVVTVVVVFIFLQPVNRLITDGLQVKNNLIALAFFQTFVNGLSVILFFPLLRITSRFLLKRFPEKEEESFYISKVPVQDTELSLEALENETRLFIRLVINYSLASFHLLKEDKTHQEAHRNFYGKTVAEKYDYIKQLYGEMHGFYLKIQQISSRKDSNERLNHLVSAIRNNMYAAKNIRDTQLDIEQIRNSSNDTKYGFYLQSKERVLEFYQQVQVLINNRAGEVNVEELTAVYRSVTTGYSETLQSLYRENIVQHISETEISTLVNFNRQLFSSFKSIWFGMKDYLLSAREAEHFDTLPGFIR
ncbi:MAG: Na/Pi cotransporter family protein [Chitinophagaceae bacterium]|nr:Na/Pi cotransporter family protein [Chitinophagaceae bacterium]